MRSRLRGLQVLLAAMCFGCAGAAEPVASTDGTVRELYRGLGMVQWRLAPGVPMQFIESESVGPRLRCVGPTVDCTVQAFPRDLSIPDTVRLDELRRRAQPYLRNSMDRGFRPREFGAGQAVTYVRMENVQGGDRGFRYAAFGHVNRGPAFIAFELLAADEQSMREVIEVVHSAKVLHAEEYWALHFSEFNAVCAQAHPQFAATNEAALAASPFGKVERGAFYKRQQAGMSADQLERDLVRARARLADYLAGSPGQRVLCASVPHMIGQAAAEL